jgi:hypothetical protein
MNNLIIDLQDYRTPGSKVFTGRDRGVEVRDKSKIDKLITQGGKITIVIPNDIRSINPSFLEEFLMNVVTKLGKIVFMEKFYFENLGRYKIHDDLEEAIERILRQENALA